MNSRVDDDDLNAMPPQGSREEADLQSPSEVYTFESSLNLIPSSVIILSKEIGKSNGFPTRVQSPALRGTSKGLEILAVLPASVSITIPS